MFEMTQIDKRVQKKLFDRISQLNYNHSTKGHGNLRDMSNSNIPVSEGSEIQLQEFMKSCWVRVTSAVPDKIETGKASANLLKLTNTFNGKTYNFNKEGKIHRPPAGVTGITTSFQNHSIQTVEISWKIYNMDDFKKYESAFLKHGRAILVEFGWGSYKPLGEIRVNDVDSMFDYFKGLEEKILDSEGNYYAAVGVVSAFNWNVVDGGGFECTTTLTSLGNTLFKAPLDKYTDQNFPDPTSLIAKNAKKISSERRATELSEAYNKANLTFGAFMAQFNEVCGALAGDMTIANLGASVQTTTAPPGENKKTITMTKKGEDGELGVDYMVLSEYTTAVDGTSRALIDPSSTLNVIDEYKREIQEHKEQIEKGDNRYGLLNALSRENRIKDLERIIKDNGGTLDE